MAKNISITIAAGDMDRLAAIKDGRVQVEGCDALLELAQINSVLPLLKEKSTQKLLQHARKQYEECQSDVDDIIAITKKK